jgi:hypothetical protein
MLDTLALSISETARSRIGELLTPGSKSVIPVIVFFEDTDLPAVGINLVDPELAADFQEEHAARGSNFLFLCGGELIGVTPGEWVGYLHGKSLNVSGGTFLVQPVEGA